MSCDFMQLTAPGVQKLQPYQPGKPIEELERELGITSIIKLASNENPFGPSPKVKAVFANSFSDIARYPDGSGFRLKRALSDYHGLPSERITLGNGSNEILELLARTFLTPDDEVIFSQYAFAVYPIVTQAVGARAVVTQANEFGHDLVAMQAAITEKTKLIFIANPNNPTGTILSFEQLKHFIKQVPRDVIVVIDEAYHEYVDIDGYASMETELEQFSNLVVCRTFSKAFGLAGIRAGYGLSSPEVAECLNRVRQPFNMNLTAQMIAEAALEDIDHVIAGVQANQQGLSLFYAAFDKLQINYIPSAGNFVCAHFGSSAQVIYQALLREGVIVRPVAGYGLGEYLRISVGTEEENHFFIEKLGKVLEQLNG